jgi:hypothetical protein
MRCKTLNLLLLFTVCFSLLSACNSRREPAANSGTATAPATSPTAANRAPDADSPQSPAASASPAAGAATAGGTTAPGGAATKSGWWVRINPNLTTAQSITFQIGTGKLQREEWRVWKAGEPTEFDVPANYAQAPRLYLRGSVTPIGKFADLCLMYKNRGVEHMGFNDDDSETKSQLQVDYKCR